jgi:hypothetical protein
LVFSRLTAPTPYESYEMIRWMLVVFLALVLINGLFPILKKIGMGRLPGDFTLKLFGKEVPVPLASTMVLSGILSLIARYI